MPPLLTTLTKAVLAVQLVQVGQPDPHACDHLWAHPNLTLQTATQLSGTLSDQTGFPFSNATVDLDRFLSASNQPTIQRTTSDAHGTFRFSTVVPGRYRLIVPSAHGFLQPTTLTCPTQGDRFLKIQLKAGSTDTLETICPIR